MLLEAQITDKLPHNDLNECIYKFSKPKGLPPGNVTRVFLICCFDKKHHLRSDVVKIKL